MLPTAGALLSAKLCPAEAPARRALARGAPLATLAMAAAQQVWDQDDDGHSPMWGGGDCDDSDPLRHPGAADTPGDGVDQDCAGGDASHEVSLATALGRDGSAGRPWPPDRRRPRVGLVVVVDALRADATAAAAAATGPSLTPRLDGLARAGVTFTRARSAAPGTWPAVPSLLTGRYPGGLRWARRGSPPALAPANVTLAERLRAHGFDTVAVVSNYMRWRLSSLGQGFTRFDSVLPANAGPEQRADTSPIFAAQAQRILEDNRQGRLFLYVHFIDPHHPYRKREGFTRGRGSRARYGGEISYVDHHLGLLLDSLTLTGEGADTLVIVTGDHGEEFGEHGGRFHAKQLYEESLRVPLVFAGAGVVSGVHDTPVSLVDVAPTVLELAGATGGSAMHGRSLAAGLYGGSFAAASRRAIFAEVAPWEPDGLVAAVTPAGLKLVGRRSSGDYELYDLRRDPAERTNLFTAGPPGAGHALATLQAYVGGLAGGRGP